MREVFLLMKYNLTTLKIYSKQGRKFKFFCQIGLKYRKIVFKYWKYILNTLKSVSKYIWFGKGYWQVGVILLTTRISGLQGLHKGALYRLRKIPARRWSFTVWIKCTSHTRTKDTKSQLYTCACWKRETQRIDSRKKFEIN